MTVQEQNGAMLLNLWNIGEHMFDAMLDGVSKQVEKVEKKVAASICKHCGEPIEPTGGKLYLWTHVDADQQKCIVAQPKLEPADDAICKNCNYPYEEHGGLESFCPNIWDEDSDWHPRHKFHQHDWRGIDTGRMCATCGTTERHP